ncbi:MAG: hypothetical protein NVS3B6_17340 [Pseudarthrobacter sp.]
MPTVRVGNPDPIHAGAKPGDVTEFTIPESKTFDEAVSDVSFDDGGPNTGAWLAHSRAQSPSWVESDSPRLAEVLAKKWGCPVGRPTV